MKSFFTNLVTLKVIAGATLFNVQISLTLTSATNFFEITFTNLVTLKADAKFVKCTNLTNTVQQSVTNFSEIIFTNLDTLKAVDNVELKVKA
jgi:hypothetical protein